MNDIAQALTQHDCLAFIWKLVVWASIAYLLALGVLAFLRPASVNRFLDGYVTSKGINFLEAALRLVAGLAYMAVSPDMQLSALFFTFGAILAISAIPMMLLYETHKRYAAWAIPFAKRILPLMAVMSIALGALITWALI